MKKVIMYLGHTYDFGHHWHWHTEQLYGDYEPYYVEIPENFHLAESNGGDMLYFRDGCNAGYQLFISYNSENGRPVLIGGSPVERITLKVLGPVEQ